MVSTRRTAREEPAADMAERDLSNTLRKKPVRKATAKKAETESKAKTTRSRKAAATIEEDAADELDDVQDAAPTMQAKPMRKAAGRKKAAEPVVEEPAPAPTTRNTAKSTRTAATRSRKPDVMVDQIEEESAPVKSRATRATKATTAKAQPLSPKKITQVSKPQTRNTKTGSQKAINVKAAPAKPTLRTRGTAKRRAVSDENADVPELAQSTEEDDDVIIISSTPVKRASPKKPTVDEDDKARSEGTMSSRPTTPSDSPAPSFDQLQDEHEYTRAPDVDDGVSTADNTPERPVYHGSEAGSSDDELCGPKTPMRRCSTSAEARWRASAPKSSSRRVETPKLRQSLQESADEETLQPPSPLFVEPEGDHEDEHEDAALDATEQPTEPESIASVPGNFEPAESIQVTNDSGNNVAEPAAQATDPDETILVMSEEAEQMDAFEAEDTVLINRAEDISELPEESEIQAEGSCAVSPTPETIVWENIRQDITIPIDFDTHFAGARSLPQTEPTERLSIAADFAIASAVRDSPDEANEDDGSVIHTEDYAAEAEAPTAADATVNLTEFIDFGALAEATQTVDLPGQPIEVADPAEAAEESEDLGQPDAVSPPTPAAPMLEDIDITGILTIDQDTSDEHALIDDEEAEVPHYALPTLAFDARRKSLPALGLRTPTKTGTRPNTSDGASMPRILDPFGQLWWLQSKSDANTAKSRATPGRARAGTMDSTPGAKSMPTVSIATPKERYPALGSRSTYTEHAKTAAMPTRFRTPAHTSQGRPKSASKPSASAVTPSASSLRAYRAQLPAAPDSPADEMETPTQPRTTSEAPVETPSERFPRLGARQTYQEHAQTAIAPTRFRMPVQQKRNMPATAQKVSAQDRIPRASALRPRPTQASSSASPRPLPATPADTTEASTDESEAAIETPSQRLPQSRSRQINQQHAQNVMPSRFRTPTQAAAKRPATAQKQGVNASTPKASALRPKPASPVKVAATPSPATPAADVEASPVSTVCPSKTPSERFPRLPARSQYEEHANTVAAPRHRTPAQTPLKRPSTVQKQGSLRKVAFKNSTPMASRTPVKTPLKPPMTTPGQVPLTPHPSAPLRSVVALVEVYTLEGASASAPFVALLHRLGAKTTKAWTDRVTHVIFKDGSPTTLQRVRLHNKGVDESGSGTQIHCVNSRWVSDCDSEGLRMDEGDEAYAVDVAEIPRGGKRRRKSMEPSALVNLGGNIVQERKSSLSRSSLGRSTLAFDSLAKKVEDAPGGEPAVEGKENTPLLAEDDGPSSPATPAYLAAPDKLIQQTAPINRMRKLGAKTHEKAKNRRLTFAPRFG